jgi:hypothetical protein
VATKTLYKMDVAGSRWAHRSMCKSARVDDDPVYMSMTIALEAKAGGCVDAVDDGAFVVGLECL